MTRKKTAEKGINIKLAGKVVKLDSTEVDTALWKQLKD